MSSSKEAPLLLRSVGRDGASGRTTTTTSTTTTTTTRSGSGSGSGSSGSSSSSSSMEPVTSPVNQFQSGTCIMLNFRRRSAGVSCDTEACRR